MSANSNTVPSPRIPLQLPVDYRKSYGRKNGKAVLKNISLTGAFLETSTLDLVPDDKVIIEFVVSDRKRKMNASIIWKNNVGCGVRFHPFNKRDVQIVDDLMYFVQNRREFRRGLLDDIFKQAA